MTAIVTDIAVSVLIGGALGMGLWSLLAALPRWGAQPLIRRIAPYIRDVTDPQATTVVLVAPADPAALIARAARSVWRRVTEVSSRLWGASEVVTMTLTQAGWSLSAVQYRERQLGVVLAAALAGAVIAMGARLVGSAQPAVIMLPLLFGVVGGGVTETLLNRAGKRRRARIEDELPTVLEFLALCLSAGEGLLDGIRRTAGVGVGELSAELRGVVLEVATGATLADALNDAARRIDVAGVQRAIDHLVAALERGAPLAAVLKDQAADARDERKRTLIERAGKNEVLMLLPLVFLILPLSILIALFPGITLLGVGLN